MATLSDVAERAGVSVSLASRVLSGAPSARARPETRQRIFAAAEELGYHPNFAGRALRLSRSNVIALVVPDVTNALFAELVAGVEEAAIKHDYVMLLARAEDMQPGGRTLERLVGEGRVDGVLLQAGDKVEPRDYLNGSRAPVILIHARREGFAGTVTLDDEAGAQLAVAHLVSLGHQRIGLVNGPPATDTARRRETGFRQAMAVAGLRVNPKHVTRLGYDAGSGRSALAQLLKTPPPPTAVLVANINAAIGLLGEARSLGVAVPEDLSVVAMHDAWTATNTWPPLTTVRMPLHQLGYTAVESLHIALRGGNPGDVLIRNPIPELVLRESTRLL